MLRVAVPNKGALAEPAREMLREAGYTAGTSPRDLVVTDEANGVEFFFLRPSDIAIYVGSGTLDLGITGLDMLLDSRAPAKEVLRLGFAPSTFRLAVPIGTVRRPSPTWPAGGSPPPTRSCCDDFLAAGRDHRRRWSASTARSRTPSGSASPTPWPTSWPPGARCARPASCRSESRCWSARPC